jgi:hypothetical protein
MMATTQDTNKIIFVKQKAGVEDLLMGLGTIGQVREGENVTITLINAHQIPYDNSRSIGDVLALLLANQG